MIPITTVTYTPDKWLTLLQAHSIEKFVKEPTTHYVYVQDDLTSRIEWESLLMPIYKRHQLILMDRNTHPEYSMLEDLDRSGYTDQQYIKLMLSKSIDSEYILSLDAKNFFIKPTSLLDSFYGNEGPYKKFSIEEIVKENITWFDFFKPWLKFVSEFINSDIPDLVWFPAPPFVFSRNTLQKIDEKILHDLFAQAKRENIFISEYLLYLFYADRGPIDNRRWCEGYPTDGREPLEFLENEYFMLCAARRDLDSIPGLRESIIKYLVNRMGMDERYVVPAINLTTHVGR